ncbi:TPA: hypothetical protein RG830_004161, partial [Vibrio vulnificus]
AHDRKCVMSDTTESLKNYWNKVHEKIKSSDSLDSLIIFRRGANLGCFGLPYKIEDGVLKGHIYSSSEY